MNKMILSIRANSFLIYFLIFVGAEARTLLEKHHGQNLAEYGRQPYITPSPPASSPPHNQEIVGRPHHLPPPAPKHAPTIGQLTSTTQGLKPHKNELYSSELLMTTSHDEVLILLPSYSSEIVGGRHDHISVGRHDHLPVHPPSPKPADEEDQIIITTSSNSCHDGNGIGRGNQKPPPTPKPSHNDGQTIISSTNTHDDDDHHSNYGREERILPPSTPRPSDEQHQTIISSTSTTHDDDDHHSNFGREGRTPPSPHSASPIGQLSSNRGAQHLPLQASY
ncbi:uncharacterized protein LOC132052272 [Lycium ferocissimum]|uniref:uncharacterized protein LOC132052272 n=1 Tax=Lycium ferocissimum TaxID=112874 RepID=UPI002815A098|nr:uncharacterized protein LOC132052272 [Lycium ferocissimum]